jgi:hypothetical protein
VFTFLKIKQKNFFNRFNELHADLNSVQTSAIAMVTGRNPSLQYPVHMLSKNNLPEDSFLETDTQTFRLYYTVTPTGLTFEARLPQNEFSLFFSLPRFIYQQYFSQRRMLEFKRGFIRSIELPFVIRNMRRILKLDLDLGWIDRQIERRENITFT